MIVRVVGGGSALSDGTGVSDFDSWKVVDDGLMIKHMDKSSFEWSESGLPKGMFMFFTGRELHHGERMDIQLRYSGRDYDAHISCDGMSRYKISWTKRLVRTIKDSFGHDWVSLTGGYPYMIFRRIDRDLYDVSFATTLEMALDEYSSEPSGVEQIPITMLQEYVVRKVGEVDFSDPMPVERRRIMATRLIRDPRINRLVKERAGYRCEICGADGFVKKDGGLYAEAHHLFELSKMEEGNRFEHPDLMICVCPTCHRIIHYGCVNEMEKRFEMGSRCMR